MDNVRPQHVWRRHDLLRIRPDAWRCTFAALPEHARVDVLSSWAVNGFPFIVRRYLSGESHDSVPVGAPLPQYLGRQRIATLCAPEDVDGRVALVSLHKVGDHAPPTWAATIGALLDLGERFDAEPHVIGGLLWQYLTGLPYLTETSDLDLLWPFSTACRPFLEELAVIDSRSPIRLDGEVALADGSAVNWRELHGCLGVTEERTVLVKSMTGIQVQPVATILNYGQLL